MNIISPKPKKVCRPSSLEFRWQEVESTEYYVVEIFDSSLKRVWESDRVRGRRYIPPQKLKILLTAPGSYFWSATAVLRNGARIESVMTEFRIK